VQNAATFRPEWAAEPAPEAAAETDIPIEDAEAALEAALELNRQRLTMARMRRIATANGTMRVDTGAYAGNLADLQAGGYAPTDALTDGWGNPFAYSSNGRDYTLISHGCDAAPGPAPPAEWTGLPCAPDIVLRDGRFVQAPAGR
jgi:hypothetical protein